MVISARFRQTFFIIILLAGFQQVGAQDAWASWSHAIPAKGFEGRPFRVQASVKTVVADDSASARLWVRVDKKDGIGFFENMNRQPIRTNSWKVFSITGTIDSAATRILIGALVEMNGSFYYDDIKVEVQLANKKWQTIYATNFENGKIDFEPGVGSGQNGINKLYTVSTPDVDGVQHKALLIEGNAVPNFGSNKKAGHFANVNGIQLYYEVYGEGPALLVLHGNGGSIFSGESHYPDLIKKYKVIAVDSRAQGRSTDTDKPLNYDQMASDVNELLEQLHQDSVLIWGQSDGAILGLILAMDYPKKVKKVLAYGANVQPDSTAVFPWAVTAIDRVIANSKDAKEIKLYTMMRDYPHISYEALHKIKAPVLIMGGDRDVIRPEHLVKMFQNIPNSQLCILPGSTHGGAWEKKEQFLKILGDFFDKPFTMPTTEDWFKE